MAYSAELKLKAKKLYIIEGNSLRTTAKILNFRRWQTIQEWSQKENWSQKRVKLEKKSDEIAEKEAFNELLKDKQDYIIDNLKAADLNKKTGVHFLLKIYEELKKGNPDIKTMQDLATLYQTVSPRVNKSILIQHKILSGEYDLNENNQTNLAKENVLALIINRANEKYSNNKP